MDREALVELLDKQVAFGSMFGVKTKGTLLKVNVSKCKIRQDEERNSRPVGTIWNVPFSLVFPISADGNVDVPVKPVEPVKPPTDFWIRDHKHEIHILCGIYNCLSPEWLTADGELPRNLVNKRRADLERKLRAVFVLLDRNMDESEAYNCLERLEKLEVQK